ncbi:hypothetical protein FRB95_013655 [Tulasnella sp. JGI-2019a]|nr:hypothetical protein FRB95_013655 [Tulasnella sp. JGI-2019a]
MAESGRLSQSTTLGRKGVRGHPTFRNDPNFGRATGKLLHLGDIDKDEDGFEDFNQYINNDSIFKSPPPAITPKRKPKPKTPAKLSGSRMGSNENIDDRLYSSRNDRTTPRAYFDASASPAGPPPTSSRRVGSRPVTAPSHQVDYDSIPAPSTRKKPMSTASTGQNRFATHTAARAGPSNTRTMATTVGSRQRPNGAATSAMAESEDSNMDVDEPPPVNDDDDDDSGPEAFNTPDDDGDGGDNQMDYDQDSEQEPEPVPSKKPDTQSRRKPDENEEPAQMPSRKADARSKRKPEPEPVPEEEEEPEPVRRADIKGGRKPAVPEPIPEEDEEMAEGEIGAGGSNSGMGGAGEDNGGNYYDDQQQEVEEQPQHDNEGEEERQTPPPKETAKEKKARLAAEKKAKAAEKKAKAGDRPPLRPKDMNAQPKKKTEFERKRNRGHEDDDDDDHDGPRRSKREKFEPLKWWKGEKVVVRRPRNGEVGVLHVEGIIRVPDDEVTHLGAKKKRRGTTKPPSTRGASKGREVYVDMNPEEGWDAETEEQVMVVDFDTGEELMKVIAHTAAMVNPKTPNNAEYSFQRVFMDGEFVAGGVLNIPVNGRKPPKASRDSTYIFYVAEGAVRVMINKTDFVITTGGMFMVPRGNMYLLENIGDRECKLFFALARKVTEKMIPSPHKATSARPSSALGDRPSRTPQRAGAAVAQASPNRGKKNWNKDVIR